MVAEEDYVLDEETNTCVPIEVAIAAVKSGDRDKNSFGPIANKSGDGTFFGYTSFADFFDGGGPGRSGSQFQGGFGTIGALGQVANSLGIRPHGYKEKRAEVVKDLKDAGVKVTDNTSVDAIIDLEANRNDDDDGPSIAEQIAAEAKHEKENIDINTEAGWESSVGAKGGYVMNPLVHYRQAGGLLPGAVPPIGAQPELPPTGPEMAPPGGPMAPPPAPPAPVAPPPPPSFSDKVGMALDKIRSGRASAPVAAAPMGPMMTDAQGDGPVEIMPGAGQMAPGMVGPDKGVDTIDTELEEGSFVLNPEASEMYGDEIRAMCKGGAVYRQGGGIVGMANDASQALGQASQAIQTASGVLGGGSGPTGTPVGTPGLGSAWQSPIAVGVRANSIGGPVSPFRSLNQGGS